MTDDRTGLSESYPVRKVRGAVRWQDLPSLSIDRVLWTADTGVRAWGQICRDDRCFHVHLRAAEKEIRAEYTAPLSPVHEDSCLEFFFRPAGADRYLNFEINPNGCLRVQLGSGRAGREELAPEGAAVLFGIRCGRTADGWEVFYSVPLSFIRRFWPDYSFGDLEANLYKCGDRTARPHYLAWQRIDLPAPDFHRPEFFGRLRVEA